MFIRGGEDTITHTLFNSHSQRLKKKEPLMSETHAPGEINTYALSCRLANDRPTGRPVLVWLVTTKSTTKCRRLVLESRNTQSIRGCLSKRMKFCDQCAIITGIHRQQSVLLRFPPILYSSDADRTPKTHRQRRTSGSMKHCIHSTIYSKHMC